MVTGWGAKALETAVGEELLRYIFEIANQCYLLRRRHHWNSAERNIQRFAAQRLLPDLLKISTC